MTKKAENYESDLLSEILSEISPQEQAKTDKRMLLALKIADAMKRKGLKKSELASLMGKQQSVITKWLSGTHNFESDTLFDLEYHLDAKLIDIETAPKEQVLKFHVVVAQKVTNEKRMNVLPEINPASSYAKWAASKNVSC